MPSPQPFSAGALYRREDVADRIGLGLRERGGNWLTGYSRVGGEFFLFVNVGVAGRTGHDYANRWDGKRLIWFGKSGTTRSQREVTDLLSGTFPIHIFWRARDRAPFTYAGLASALEAAETSPVQVTWLFDNGDETSRPSIPRWRRGPPPTPGERLVSREDGETSIYLLVLEGPTMAVFPGLSAKQRIVKVGMSNDTARRVEDLSCGFPPGCALHWRIAADRRVDTGLAAFGVETGILERLRLEGKSIGGEFAIVDEREIAELAMLI